MASPISKLERLIGIEKKKHHRKTKARRTRRARKANGEFKRK